MSAITKEQVLEVLRTVKDPELGKDVVTLGMVKDLEVNGRDVSMEIVLTTPACPLKERFTSDITLALRGALPEVGEVTVRFGAEVRGSRPVEGNKLPGVKNVIAVGSGKGGVGKSTVAVNLALALQQEGARVGLLDADIYGPSIPIMCGIREEDKPMVGPNNIIIPLKRFDMPLMSMGFLIGARDAVIWRGPMLARVLQQFLEQVHWGELDYLVVDLPPGTGDVQLTLSQLIPLSGAVVVTTPQDVAMADVVRAIKMFEVTKVPLLGIVENMSFFDCPHCHKSSRIFGGTEDNSRYKNLDLPLLGQIPLEIETRIGGDEGTPIVVREIKSAQAERFRKIARQIAAAQSVQNFQKELELPVLQ